MKIALVAPSEIPSRRANSVQVMKMAQAISACGHAVRVAAPLRQAWTGGSEPHWDELARLYGLRQPFEVSWLPARTALRGYGYGLAAFTWARRWGADVLYTRLPQAAALGSLSGMSTVLEAHDLPAGKTGPLLLRLFLAGRGARRLVTITQALADDLARRYRLLQRAGLLLTAPDGVDLERFEQLPESVEARRRLRAQAGLALREEAFTAGYSGHLYAGRGIELILQVAQALPEMQFLVAGGEPEQVQRLRQQTAGMALDNLIAVGFVDNTALPLYQAACDVLLMPYQKQVSGSSGGNIAPYLSPMKLFEYLACGRAILSSDLPVLAEVLHEGNSLILPADQPAAWVQALQALQADPERRAALAAQGRMDAQQYSWEARSRRIFEDMDENRR
jgi:glycosyltransferase involved in cell wall biosynthesis